MGFTFFRLHACREVGIKLGSHFMEEIVLNSRHLQETVGGAKEQLCPPVAITPSPSSSLDRVFPNLQIITTFPYFGRGMPSYTPPESCHSVKPIPL